MNTIHHKRKFVHNLSESQIRDLFMEAMQLAGLIFESSDLPIQMDGKTRYLKVEGRSRSKRNSRSGWYVGHLGDFPVGQYGWKHGNQAVYTWKLYDHIKEQNQGKVEFIVLSEDELALQQAAEERRLKLQKIEQQKRLEFSRAYTLIEYHRSRPVSMHPYLGKKKIALKECSADVRVYNQAPYTKAEVSQLLSMHLPHYHSDRNIEELLKYQQVNIKYRGFNLLIAGRDIDDQLVMFQLIFDKKSEKSGKDKHYPKNLLKQNSFHVIGPALGKYTRKVIICEGWATGISLGRLTQGKTTILVAWDSGNMNSVAKVIRRKYPDCQIYSANDNDHTKPPEHNAGVLGGLKTCHAVGAYLLTAPFNSSDPQQQDWSDWNDIDLNYPVAQAQLLFDTAMAEAPFIGATYEPGRCLMVADGFMNEADVVVPEQFEPWQLEQLGITWVAMLELINHGLMHCGLTDDERCALFLAKYKATQDSFGKILPMPRNHQPIMDKKAALVLLNFTYHLKISSKNLMASHEIFIPALKQLLSLQKSTTLNLITCLRDMVATMHSAALANACLMLYLESMGELRASQDWHNAVLNGLKPLLPAQPEMGLVYSLLVQHPEKDYLEDYPLQHQRQDQAALAVWHQYQAEVDQFIRCRDEMLDKQKAVHEKYVDWIKRLHAQNQSSEKH